MALNNAIEPLLNELKIDEVKALLLWYLQDETAESNGISQKVQQLLDDVNRMDAEASYKALTSLKLDDMVRFSVLNEFGEGFSKKKACDFLIKATIERFAIAAAINAV